MMLFGSHPLLAYAVVGLGAAAYSPAKYGILTELLPPSQLVKANGWIEGLTIASIILGILLGGQLIGPRLSPCCWASTCRAGHRHRHRARSLDRHHGAGLHRGGAVQPVHPAHRGPAAAAGGQPGELVRDFAQCNARLWGDKLGQISLATTTLFWGVFGNLRVIVFAWAAAALGYSTTQASNAGRGGDPRLGRRRGGGLAVHAAGPRGGRDAAGHRDGLPGDRAELHHQHLGGGAVPGLLGAVCGYLVVPMNALLQHRGHNLMGAGRSIAVQNFNEQACILALGAFYTGMVKLGLSAFTAIAVLGLSRGRRDVADQALAPAQLHRPRRRGGTPARHRPHRQALTPKGPRRSRTAARGAPSVALGQ
jgi:LPLT family lysophospholipid transporter-like MFS transporter